MYFSLIWEKKNVSLQTIIEKKMWWNQWKDHGNSVLVCDITCAMLRSRSSICFPISLTIKKKNTFCLLISMCWFTSCHNRITHLSEFILNLWDRILNLKNHWIEYFNRNRLKWFIRTRLTSSWAFCGSRIGKSWLLIDVLTVVEFVMRKRRNKPLLS